MVCNSTYNLPHYFRNSLAMTAYTAVWAGGGWERTNPYPEPVYQQVVLTGGQDVPIFGWVAIAQNACSTIIRTYGITGELQQKWFLKLLGRKSYSQSYAVVLFN